MHQYVTYHEQCSKNNRGVSATAIPAFGQLGVTDLMFFYSATGNRVLMRRLHWLVFCVCLLCLISVARSQDVPDRAVANAIEAYVDGITQPGAAQIRGLSVAWPELIHRFYAQRDFRPAWDRSSVVNDLHRALRVML